MIKKITQKKSFHIAMLIIIITCILFAFGLIVLRYQVEGETNMPFNLSKIMIISTADGIEKQPSEFKWDYDVFQTNDIFLSIDKTNNQEATISSVTISNVQAESKNKEKIKFYRPDSQIETAIFKNSDENVFDTLEYQGDLESNLKQLKISNQGGLVAFRCSFNDLAHYTSNDDTEVKNTELLKKSGVSPEDLQLKLTFDLSIRVENNDYTTTICLSLPSGNVVEDGTTSSEITDLKDFIFKRN